MFWDIVKEMRGYLIFLAILFGFLAWAIQPTVRVIDRCEYIGPKFGTTGMVHKANCQNPEHDDS